MSISNLFFYIHYCGRRQPNEEWKYKPKITRTLEHHELILITGGNGNIIIQNRKYKAREGVIFYIPADTLQSIESDFKNHLYFISIHFSFVNVLFSNNKWDIKNRTKILPLSSMQEVKDCYEINYLFRRLTDSWNEKLPSYEFVTKVLLEQLIFQIYQNEKKENHNYSVTLKVENIIKYMRENMKNKLTLTELADRVKLSPAYLSRAFKSSTGYTVIGLFNKIKIDKAKELMIEGNKKVKDIAHEVGFNDEFYFSRIFKKVEGISPSEFYSKNIHGV
ncbi:MULTISPECIES: AraC family transcriptional regulator [Clostridium]|uniref:AraC family transcriptional regulator n=1 Tax=Clostridium TaxID=1485 RepID=UPI000826FA6A|nr:MULTISPECIES: AraC family transcriptional regulator [Clostridium]PJI07581.1 AraC family transcriptional regulator [Clostridium sp. CT7]